MATLFLAQEEINIKDYLINGIIICNNELLDNAICQVNI